MTLTSTRNDTLLLFVAITLGMAFGILQPDLAVRMKPLSDLFLTVIGHAVPVLMFVLVASAVAGLGRRGEGRRCAGRMLLYFQLVGVLALITGAAAALLLAPGADSPSTGAVAAAAPPVDVWAAVTSGLTQVLGHTLILPILLAALAFGLWLGLSGTVGEPWRRGLDACVDGLLAALRLLLRFAPLAAFGAMAFTFGRYGPASAWPLLKFIGTVYLACFLFVVLVMGTLARCTGFGLWRLVLYIKEELCLVAFTGASVAAVPGLVDKLERAGCDRALLRLVLSSGYTFNLAGSNIYLTCAIVFLAQLAGVSFDGAQWLSLLLVTLLTSLGSTSAAGSSFLTLAATLGALGLVPLDSLGILLGVERLMKCRSLTNVLGNSLACLVIAAWSGALDRAALREALGARRKTALADAMAGKR
ncbi:cation:dicarboxylate symporter family transporter [Stutzerimonas azotifigens]|uniref:cation:dicarboxylate symporter family transporter n=1 Tax=Stutzerimonas azotifigens TaxID=291995 RepID=UPI0004012EC7|nr:cation:dicarboxylase symporter family transporter [Stutzerimonas azotifigens]